MMIFSNGCPSDFVAVRLVYESLIRGFLGIHFYMFQIIHLKEVSLGIKKIVRLLYSISIHCVHPLLILYK